MESEWNWQLCLFFVANISITMLHHKNCNIHIIQRHVMVIEIDGDELQASRVLNSPIK